MVRLKTVHRLEGNFGSGENTVHKITQDLIRRKSMLEIKIAITFPAFFGITYAASCV
jgi:hypothetical protein